MPDAWQENEKECRETELDPFDDDIERMLFRSREAAQVVPDTCEANQPGV